MPKTIYFNTGRKYTVHGQRITATRYDDGRVTFWDHDRCVDGEYVLEPGETFDARSVQARYDAGTHTKSLLSFQDGMAMGGSNTKFEG